MVCAELLVSNLREQARMHSVGLAQNGACMSTELQHVEAPQGARQHLGLIELLTARFERTWASDLPVPEKRYSPPKGALIEPGRESYLGEIARSVRDYHAWADEQVGLARKVQHLETARELLDGAAGQRGDALSVFVGHPNLTLGSRIAVPPRLKGQPPASARRSSSSP